MTEYASLSGKTSLRRAIAATGWRKFLKLSR